MKATTSVSGAAATLAEIARSLAVSVDLEQIVDPRDQAAELLLPITRLALGRNLLNRAAELKLRADLKQIMGLHDQVTALLLDIRTSALGPDLLRQATELKLRIERKGGQILASFHLRGGDHKTARAARKLSLEHLGLLRKQSADWQLEALLPEEDFAAYLKSVSRKGKQPSSHGLRCLARAHVEGMKIAAIQRDPIARVACGLQNWPRRAGVSAALAWKRVGWRRRAVAQMHPPRLPGSSSFPFRTWPSPKPISISRPLPNRAIMRQSCSRHGDSPGRRRWPVRKHCLTRTRPCSRSATCG